MSYSFAQYKHQDEADAVNLVLNQLNWTDVQAQETTQRGAELIQSARNKRRRAGEIETFLREYGLTTDEGRALMTLAEALLRIPDAENANDLIKDKLDDAAWPRIQTDDWMLKATALGLNITKKTLNSIFKKLGEPVVRVAVAQAMKIMGKQFVVGQTIKEAVKNGRTFEKEGYALSFDMLGEGARTVKDAERYYQAYVDALEALGGMDVAPKTGISVKLSALHPRYEFAHRDICVPVLTDKLVTLCQIAKAHDLRLTVDAEEADRLEISLDIFKAAAVHPSLQGWSGMGLAVQAYQKRALHVVDHVSVFAREKNLKLHIRLVKGAYWDSEIKHAQAHGFADYPVYTRKANTDASFLACAHKMLQNRDVLTCLFGTHNAHTIAAIIELAKNETHNLELQRLHGMGENLYAAVKASYDIPCTIYAPVGPHQDLLPYLVRRLLENGANSSFVHRIFDENYAPVDLAQDVIEGVALHPTKRHPKIPLPANIFYDRENSRGLDFADGDNVALFQTEIEKTVVPTTFEQPYVEKAFAAAGQAYKTWSKKTAEERARILEKAADLLERDRDVLCGLCVKEAGKTLPDSIDEVREAIDFCRYYALRGRIDFNSSGQVMPSITGEENRLTLEPRGTFVCISPWNFPLAIFTGQVMAALMAGNTVIAKPAEQTPAIAARAVKIFYEAGVPKDALHLLIGDGKTGAQCVAHSDTAGVVFTGSSEVAKLIQRSLADKEGPIVPLIAETGGLNAMIVDSSALIEQVVDDALQSAFGSAGQRCSALRLLCVQDEIADKTIEMLIGAIAELHVGDPFELRTDVGPIIDQEALHNLHEAKSRLEGTATKIAEANISNPQDNSFAPVAFEIKSLDDITQEIFGPVLHVYRYKLKDLDQVIETINGKGYGLTFGIQSRISDRIEMLSDKLKVGNVYVNRTTIGAIVQSQPFGGRGLSGTGPKAGGPHYLHAFATEKTVTINTTASGGNAHLVSLEESPYNETP